MPFVSTSQQRFAFGTHQPWAKRWAKQTNFKRLPYKKRKKERPDTPDDRSLARFRYPLQAIAPAADTFAASRGQSSAGPDGNRSPLSIAQLEAFVSSEHYDAHTADAIAQRIPALPSLKGEQIAPGITRIHGNLCNVHGRYGPCDAALSGKKPLRGRKPRKPRQTPAQRATARSAQRQTNADSVAKRMAAMDTGLSPSGSKALVAFAQGQQPDPAIGEGLAKMGLVEQASDGSYRMTPTGHAAVAAMAAGDYQRTIDAVSRGTEHASAHAGRTAEHAKRQQDIAGRRAAAQMGRELAQRQRADAQAKRAADQAKKPVGAQHLAPGGSKKPAQQAVEKPAKPIRVKPPKRGAIPSAGGLSSAPSKPKPVAPVKAPAKQIAPALIETAQNLSDGKQLSDADTLSLIRNGLAKLNKDGTLILTAAGMTATKKAAPAAGDYLVAEDPQKSSTWHLQVRRGGKVDHSLMGSAWAALHSGFRGNTYQGPQKDAALAKLKKLYISEKMPLPATKDSSFRVFKDASGNMRWVAQSSTAYQDRDKEIVSTKALADDCRFADKHGAYGPLRWWHCPGLDLGDCDFNAMHGRVLLESGTFRSPAIAQKVARAADILEISLGFLHLPTEPDASGVFHHIRRFERSLVPRGKASNRFTAFRVKERPMFDPTKVAALKTLGFSDDDITNLQTQAEATEKAADAQQVAYKADDAEPEAELPDLVINGVTYKAFGAPTMKPPAADAEDAAEPPETPGEAPDAEDLAEAPEDTGGGLTLSPEDISAIGQAVSDALTTALGPLVSTMDLTNKIGNHMTDLKNMMGGYQTKKDATDAEKAEQILALQVSLKDTQTKLDELLGLQPAVAPRASAAPQTALNPFNPADNALLQSVKDQVPVDQQQYVNGFEDLKLKLFGP